MIQNRGQDSTVHPSVRLMTGDGVNDVCCVVVVVVLSDDASHNGGGLAFDLALTPLEVHQVTPISS